MHDVFVAQLALQEARAAADDTARSMQRAAARRHTVAWAESARAEAMAEREARARAEEQLRQETRPAVCAWSVAMEEQARREHTHLREMRAAQEAEEYARAAQARRGEHAALVAVERDRQVVAPEARSPTQVARRETVLATMFDEVRLTGPLVEDMKRAVRRVG